MKHDIKMICCDLDGTLLNGDHQISKQNLAAIALAQSQGIFVTICSGRLPTMLALFAKQLQIDGPLIACNGALVVDAISQEIIEEHPMAFDEVKKLIDYCKERGLDHSVLSLTDSYFSKTSQRKLRFDRYNAMAKAAGMDQMSLKFFEEDGSLLDQRFYKMLIYEHNVAEYEQVKRFIDLQTNLCYTSSDEGLLDVSAPHVSKGAGVVALAKHLGIGLDQVCVFGDWSNDLSMFAVAKMGVAMANAHPDLKQVATHHTTSNEEHGVADALYRYILNGMEAKQRKVGMKSI